MTNEISKNEWKQFLDELSKEYSDWQTKVEVFKGDIGAQVLSEGLPLIGLMFEERANGGRGAIEVMLGEESGVHQTHAIVNPDKVFFEKSEANPGGIIEIEDESGTKTLVSIVQPISVLMTYEETRITAQI